MAKFERGDFDRCFATGKGKNDVFGRGEKKRQQSRSAAKSRRMTESEIYAQLTDALPTIDQPTVYQLDRIAALRLALTLCRVRRVGEKFFSADNGNSNWCKLNPGSSKYGVNKAFMEESISQISMDSCIDGFLMVVNKVGQLLYVTPGVAESVGFTQIDLVGRYLRDYVHADDWQNLRDTLRKLGDNKPASNSSLETDTKTFFRMKTALTPRGGRARKLTMAVYQPLQGFVIKPIANGCSFEGYDYDEGSNETAEVDQDIRLIHCIPFTLSQSRRPPMNILPTLTSRHDLDMRFRICDETFAQHLGYKNSKSFIGKSYYDLIHPDDVPNVARDIREMYQNCHSKTGYYRLLDRMGDPIWVCTEMLLLVQNIRGVPQKSVICSHLILSESDMSIPFQNIFQERVITPVQEVEEDDDETVEYASNFEQSKDDQCLNLVQSAESNRFPIDNFTNLTPIGPIQSDHFTNLTPIGPVQSDNQQIPQSKPWLDEQIFKKPFDLEPPKDLAPFIPFDTQSLTPLDDPEMPGLLPAFYDHWLSGNPILEPEVRKTEPDLRNPLTLPAGQNFSANDGIPLEFADIFGMNFDENQFSIEEAERAFSQFDTDQSIEVIDRSIDADQSIEVIQSDRQNLSTPKMDEMPSSDNMVPIAEAPIASRKRSYTMYSTPMMKRPNLGKKIATEESAHRRRLDSKTIESFELEIEKAFGQQATSDDYFAIDDFPMRQRSRSFHHKSTADAQIDRIKMDLFKNT